MYCLYDRTLVVVLGGFGVVISDPVKVSCNVLMRGNVLSLHSAKKSSVSKLQTITPPSPLSLAYVACDKRVKLNH